MTIKHPQIHRAFQPESSTQEEPTEEKNPERQPSSKPKSVSFTENETIVSNVSTPTDDISSAFSPRRSERSNKGSHQSMRYTNEVFLLLLQVIILPPRLLTWLIRLEWRMILTIEKSTILIQEHMLLNLKLIMKITLPMT